MFQKRRGLLGQSCEWVFLLTCLFFSAFSYSQASQKVFTIPDVEQYKAFLYSDWKPNRPTVLVFKDPYCPYCIKAIPKLGAITDYNVFMFWAPILGPRSVATVDKIFRCDAFASAEVLDAVQQRKPVSCTGSMDKASKKLNDDIVSAYDINSVPSFFVQGKRVSLARLRNDFLREVDVVNGAVITWDRYKNMQTQIYPAKTQALILPVADLKSKDDLLKKYKPKYLFYWSDKDDWEAVLCSEDIRNCSDNGYVDTYKRRAQEFVLLTNLEGDLNKPFYVDQNGLFKLAVLNHSP